MSFLVECFINKNLDSTRSFYTLPTISSQTTTPMTSLMFNNNARFRVNGNMNNIPKISTCNPTARDVCNSGECILIVPGIYGCHCRPGYTGAYCENSWVTILNYDDFYMIIFL